ncbi:MAG: LamG-like jellyroll fold domain-containing protein [Christensenellales bacterium]|jgi:uncharacterized repeat protein (TIGR02543 family)
MAETIRRNFTAVFLALAMLTIHIPMLSITANALGKEPTVNESADFATDAIKTIALPGGSDYVDYNIDNKEITFKGVNFSTSANVPVRLPDDIKLKPMSPVPYSIENNSAYKYSNIKQISKMTTISAGVTAGGTGFAPVAGFGNALDFIPNKRIDIPYNDSTKLAGNSDFTVSMWIFPEANSPYQTLYTQYKTNSNALGVWLRYINGNGGYLYFGFNVLGKAWQWPWVWSSGPPVGLVKLPVNQWYHVAMTKSGKNVIVYVDGAKYYEMVLDDLHYNAPAPASATISVGGEFTENQYFDGRIDEVRFWNTALSQSEIEDWMFREIDSTNPRYGDLVFYYKLNQSSGTNVTDSMGSNHGTTVGMTDTNWVASDVREWTVKAGTSINGQLIGSDADGSSTDGSDWNLSFEIVTQPLKGNAVITKDNRFTYTADLDKLGSDAFTYKVQDPAGNYSNIHTLNINIIPAIFTVTFETNGGEYVANQNVVYGEKVTTPANPTKAGYTFAGWYKEPSLTNEWVFAADTVTADTVLYAKWEADTLISVDVTWGSMEFAYSDGTWNPDTHLYEGAGWQFSENADRILVTSSSNVPVTVSYLYGQATGYTSVNGNFTDGIYSVTSQALPKGDIIPQSCYAYLILSGKPPVCNNSTIGSVTITIED